MFDAIRAWLFSRKSVSENSFTKKGPQHENKTLSTCPEAPREAASRAHFSNTKQQFDFEVLFKLVTTVSQEIENAVWVDFNLQMFQSSDRKMWRINVKSPLLVIWYALGQGLANWSKILANFLFYIHCEKCFLIFRDYQSEIDKHIDRSLSRFHGL